MRVVMAEEPGAPEAWCIRQVPVPEPGPGQVRVRVAYCSLNVAETRADEAPFVPGSALSGMVEAVGSGVDGTWLGRAVSSVAGGGCADYALVDTGSLVSVPWALGWQAAAVLQTRIYPAWHAFHGEARARAGQHLLLAPATGSACLLCAQMARERGLAVYGLCASEAEARFAAPFGVPTQLDLAGSWKEELLQRTGGRGIDLVIGEGGLGAVEGDGILASEGRVVPVPPVAVAPPEKARVHGALREGRWKVAVARMVPLEQAAELLRQHGESEPFGETLVRVGGDL